MDSILEIDAASLISRCEPGVLNVALKDEARASELWYAPDPASFQFSTLGGNVATNAGGLCCTKYGVTRDALLGLEVVLADGRAVRLGRRTRKGVAGYDLVALFCGSEGTLGVITEITSRLIPQPPAASTVTASFPSLGAAGAAVARIVRESAPAMVEIMDATTIAAVESLQPMELDQSAAAMIFARSDHPGSGRSEEVDRITTWCSEAGADLVVASDDPSEGELLMAARRLAYPALERLGATLLDDVAVPVGRVAELLDAVATIAEAHELTIGTFGHAADGNLHPTIVYPHGDEQAVLRVRAAFDAIVRAALGLGGTVTGEHGVGVLKRHLLPEELGDAHRLHVGIKEALDPLGILNPGKLV